MTSEKNEIEQQGRIDKEVLEKYRLCMEEIKRRTEVIHGFLAREFHSKYLVTTVESIALQTRNILELTALASLVANKNEYAKHRKNFRRDWHATRILQTLEEVNPEFYPVPNIQILDETTGQVVRIENITSGFLTKQEYSELYDTCSDMIHVDNPFSDQKNPKVFLKNVPNWTNKITRLLTIIRSNCLTKTRKFG